MSEYQIYVGPHKEHRVQADSESEAIENWMADQAWETPEEAIRQYGEPKVDWKITAVRIKKGRAYD